MDYGRAVGLGVGVGMATRAATTLTLAPYIKLQERKAKIAQNDIAGQKILEDMKGDTLDIPQLKYEGELRTGQNAIAMERQRIAGESEVPMDPSRQNAAIDMAAQDRPADLLKMVNTMRSQLGDPPMPDDTNPLTLAALAKAKYNSIPDGPSWSGVGDDRTVIMKPVLGGGIVPDEDLARGVVAGQIADNPINAMKDPSIMADAQLQVKSSALTAAGIDPEMARRPELIQPGMPVKEWMNFVSDKLTRGQYTRAMLDLDYTGDELTRQVMGKAALAANDPLRYAVGIGQPKCPTPDGGDLTQPLPGNAGTASMIAGAWGLRPYAPMLSKLTNDTKIPLGSLDTSVQRGINVSDAGKLLVQKALGYITKDIPKKWGRGMQRQDLMKMIFFNTVSPEVKEQLSRQTQYDLKGVAPKDRMTVLATRLLASARDRDSTPGDVIKAIEATKPNFKVLSDWLARQGGLSYEQMVNDYVPLFHKYLELPEGDTTTWGDVVRGAAAANRARYRAEDVERAINLGDISESLMKKGYTNMGQGTASYELQRSLNREWMSRMTTEPDIIKQFSMLASRVINKRVFENMLPSIQGVLDFTTESFRKENKPGLTLAIKKITQDYLNSSMGVPETELSVSRQLNLRSQSTFIGRLVDGHLNRMQKWFGHIHDFSGPLTLHDITSDVMGMMYPMTLGIPFNMKAPLENILNQTPMAAAFGMSNFTHGMAGLYNARSSSVREELAPLIHGMQHDEDIKHIMSTASFMTKVQELTMHYFTWSDMEQRLGAGATARYAFDRLAPLLKADPTFQNVTMEQMGKTIWGGKTPSQLGMDLDQIAKGGVNLKTMEMFKSGAPHGFSGIESLIYGMIRKGDAPLARETLIKYGADLAGFRYGRGGTPRLLGGVLKPLLMFASYPLNYVEWQALMLNPKNELLKNWAGVTLVQTLAAALASTMGIATADRWLLTGPLPKEFGLQGPVTQFLNAMLGSATGVLNTATANVLPGVSDEEKKRVHMQMTKSLSDLGQRMWMVADAII